MLDLASTVVGCDLPVVFCFVFLYPLWIGYLWPQLFSTIIFSGVEYLVAFCQAFSGRLGFSLIT
jgi:hypothetical protein